MKDTYVYPAVFDYEEDGIAISFIDLPGCLSCASNDEEALHNAKEALGLYLYGLEVDGESIPAPTTLKDVACGERQKAVLVEVFMPVVRQAASIASVKKTLTIPAWLDALAEQHHVNFSQVLQQALKDLLGSDRPA